MKEKAGIFSFFSGAGFLDLGFENTGAFETLLVNEYHQPFMDIYVGSRKSLNIPSPQYGYHVADVNSFLEPDKATTLSAAIADARKSYPVIGFIGGPPCPDFSVAGKNRGKEGENGKLSGSYVELICRNRPDFFLFENVKGLWRTKKHREFYESLKDKLIQNGYLVSERLINSLEYGVPQDRERIIMVGFHQDFLKKHSYKHNNTPYLWNFGWNSAILYDKDKIFALPWQKSEPFVEDSVKEQPTSIPLELSVEHWFQKNEVNAHRNSGMIFTPKAGLVKFKSVEEGDDKKKSYKRLHRWRYSPTAAYGNNEVHLHPYKARRISVAEALAIQSLPKEYIIPQETSLTNAFKAIGNGVPYLAGRGLAMTILNFINNLDSLKIEAYGTANRSELGGIYRPAAEAEQLSVLEPDK